MNKRSHSQQYLDDFRKFGRFPAIHRDMADLVTGCTRARRFLDLACGTGLLGAQVVKRMGIESFCLGVDSNVDYVSRGIGSGVPIQFHVAHVKRSSLTDLHATLVMHRIDAVLARRCVPELWGHDLEGGRSFPAMLHVAGVKEVYLEGRGPAGRLSNALPTVEHEIELFRGHFTPLVKLGRCAYLRRK